MLQFLFIDPPGPIHMQVYYGLPHDLLRRPSAIAIGNFDGVHIGHQALLHDVVHAAHERGLQPAVVTFRPHPRERLFHKDTEALPRISTLYDKVLRILDCGIERVYILPFFRRFASLTGQEFIRHVLVDGLNAHWITVGRDFHFGADRQGNVDLLQEMSSEGRYELYIAPTLMHTGERVSSTRLRNVLEKGDLIGASRLLGHSYTMTGRVIHGAALGRQLGFPTLNIQAVPPASPARPAAQGVFAVRIYGLERYPLHGVASIGCKPTVSTNKQYLLETHVFDWSGDAYGKIIRVEFMEHLRDEKKFASLDRLTQQIQNDANQARRLLGYVGF